MAGFKNKAAVHDYPDAASVARYDNFTIPLMTRVSLPPGIDSLDMWAKSLFVLPKYKDLKLSYKGLLNRAWNDAGMLSYIRWLSSTYDVESSDPKPGKATDFVAFVRAVKVDQVEPRIANPAGITSR